MKVHFHSTVGNQVIVYWYDPAYGWVIQRREADTDMDIDADYVGPRSALAPGLDYAVFKATNEQFGVAS